MNIFRVLMVLRIFLGSTTNAYGNTSWNLGFEHAITGSDCAYHLATRVLQETQSYRKVRVKRDTLQKKFSFDSFLTNRATYSFRATGPKNSSFTGIIRIALGFAEHEPSGRPYWCLSDPERTAYVDMDLAPASTDPTKRFFILQNETGETVYEE